VWPNKHEEPKAPVPSPEVQVPARVEATISPAASIPAREAARETASPAGHLPSSLIIKGEITGREDFFIDGEVQGTIHLDDGKVTIGPNGRVTADVEAREIVVRGKVKGNLHGRDRVQIGRTGRTSGDVVTRFISIEEGAEVHGSIDVTRAEEPRASRVTSINPGGEKTRAMPLPAKESSTSS
jgi:cytoskeletal protein CcmA (bactofilin family)